MYRVIWAGIVATLITLRAILGIFASDDGFREDYAVEQQTTYRTSATYGTIRTASTRSQPPRASQAQLPATKTPQKNAPADPPDRYGALRFAVLGLGVALIVGGIVAYFLMREPTVKSLPPRVKDSNEPSAPQFEESNELEAPENQYAGNAGQAAEKGWRKKRS